MIQDNTILPFNITLSFSKLIDQYKRRIGNENNTLIRNYLEQLLEYINKYPSLYNGLSNQEELISLKEPITFLLSDLFPGALTYNEIKVATPPLCNLLFNHTERFKEILISAGNDYIPQIQGLDEKNMYIMACTFILNKYYNKSIDFKRPMYYHIPDDNGIVRSYKIAINADFTEISPRENAPEITEEDISLLLQSFDDITIWKEKFPPFSWNLKGFSILNLTDVTLDNVNSDLKSNLLEHNPNTKNDFKEFEANFGKLFNNIDLRVGFTLFNKASNTLVKRPEKQTESFLLGSKTEEQCSGYLCEYSYEQLINQHKVFSLADVEDYAKKTSYNDLARTLLNNDIKSCIFAPIVYQKELLGILEIVSSNKNELNSVNANKLDDILPYIVTTAKRSKDLAENQIKAVIQSECTSIHPTVLWKFEEEAQRFLTRKIKNEEAVFNDIRFDYVFPLFGQIDIKGSSEARNDAIQTDLIFQLNTVKKIFKLAKEKEALPFYEQMMFRIEQFIEELEKGFNTTSEETLLRFLSREINPIMPHIKNLSKSLKQEVDRYDKLINIETGIISDHRLDYEQSVQIINEHMAAYLDKKQEEAQAIFPHFYERFKTDGVEHNMYIGQSLVKDENFNKVYLNNLRLWQLTTMCDMENNFYSLQNETPLKLDCASLILVFSNSLSIRYRVDEKKFDVDGSYNARYEIIKKRIDKAFIKGTEERITQKGKLVIVYSQKKDELEYMRYLDFLKTKDYVANDLELLELEDLQGVIGLKALRVSIIYNKPNGTITYNDLIKQIENR